MLYIFYSITLLSLFINTVLSVFFLSTNKGKRHANILLSVLLFIFSLQIFYSFTISNYAFSYFISYHKSLFLIRQSSLLIGPILLMYSLAFHQNKSVTGASLIHSIPAAVSVVLLAYNIRNVDSFVIWESGLEVYNTLFILLHNLIYIALSTRVLGKSKFFTKAKSSGWGWKIASGWLQYFILAIIAIWIINLNSFALYMIINKPIWCAYTYSIYALFFFILILSAIMLLLLKPEIYFIVEKYKDYPIKHVDIESYIQKLDYYMKIHKPYLRPEITIEELANEISIPSRQLSQIINSSFNTNFKGYLNNYRINECIRELSNSENSKNIQEILFDSGFNSVSVFYSEFKKRTNQTPQEYRSTYLNKKRERAVV